MPTELVPLSTISSSQLVLFASALISYVNETPNVRTQRLERIYETLERILLRPDLIVRVLTGGQSRYTPLCADHKLLNASPVHSLFLLIKIEVGVRLNSLVQAGRERVGESIWDRMILNLRSLHGLWLPVDIMKATFGTSLQLETNENVNIDYYRKWPLEHDRCEACMVSRITGDYKTLFDLRTAVLSRFYNHRRRKNNPPQLWAWIEAWMGIAMRNLRQAGLEEMAQKNLKQSDLVAASLHSLRRDLAKTRKREKKYKKEVAAEVSRGAEQKLSGDCLTVPGRETVNIARLSASGGGLPTTQRQPVSDGTEADLEDNDRRAEKSAYDAEHEIIDCYAALISTPFRPSMTLKEHQRAERHLSTFVSSNVSLASTAGAIPQELRGNTNPYRLHNLTESCGESLRAGGKTEEQDGSLARDQPYTAPRVQWKKQPQNICSPSRTKTSSSPPSNVFSQRNSSNSTWTDVTVPPSQVTVAKLSNDRSNVSQIRKSPESFSLIGEERALRQSDRTPRKFGRNRQSADNYPHSSGQSCRYNGAEKLIHQPISPISHGFSDVPLGFHEAVSPVLHHEAQHGKAMQQASKESESWRQKQERQLVMDTSHEHTYQLKSKLSRPFSMPVYDEPDQGKTQSPGVMAYNTDLVSNDQTPRLVTPNKNFDGEDEAAHSTRYHKNFKQLTSCGTAFQGASATRPSFQKTASRHDAERAPQHKPGAIGVLDPPRQVSLTHRNNAVSTQTTWTGMYRHLLNAESGHLPVDLSGSTALCARQEEEANQQVNGVKVLAEEQHKIDRDRAQALKDLEGNAGTEGLISKTLGILQRGLSKKESKKRG